MEVGGRHVPVYRCSCKEHSREQDRPAAGVSPSEPKHLGPIPEIGAEGSASGANVLAVLLEEVARNSFEVALGEKCAEYELAQRRRARVDRHWDALKRTDPFKGRLSPRHKASTADQASLSALAPCGWSL